MIPKARLDAITDGVFAFAMTLLVLDLRLPDGFDPHTSGELIGALKDLWSQYLAYIISFYVLGVRWIAQAGEHGVPEMTSGRYARWVLIYLFFITCIPFSTMVIGRHGDLAPAVWVYGANMILSALASLRMAYVAEKDAHRKEHVWRPEMATLIASAALSIALSFVIPSYASLAYAANVWPFFFLRHRRKKSEPSSE